MIEVSIKSKVEGVKLPQTNVYYERDSIDGYAFLGWARQLMGMDTSEVEEIMEEKAYGLNAKYTIRGTELPPDAIYAYSCYPTYEFYRAIGRRDRVDNIIYWLDKIGPYDNGMMKYCNTETNYIVPNVTPLTALVYLKHGQPEKCTELMKALSGQQEKDGNWRYNIKGTLAGTEDSMHLAMMVCALREIQELNPDMDTGDMVQKAVNRLEGMNKAILQTGTVGWNPPFLAVALRGISEFKDLYDRAYKKTYTHTISNTNFRVRAISAWALALIEKKPEP